MSTLFFLRDEFEVVRKDLSQYNLAMKTESTYQKKKKRIYEIIQIGQRGDFPSKAFDAIISVVVVVNILIMFLQTFDGLSKYSGIFGTIEIITIIVFCAEYVLRIWTANLQFPDKSTPVAILKFLVSFDGIVMLLTILPFFYLSGFVALRMLRVVRLMHLFRINATYDSFNVITEVLAEKRNQIFSSIFIIFILMLASSLCMYNVEHEVQPDNFDNAFSGIWWSVSTILTVGYGDIYPITVLGRIMAIIIAILGVGAVAIPTGIISAGFVENYTKMANTKDMSVPATVNALVEKDGQFEGMTVEGLRKHFKINPLMLIRDGNVLFLNEKTKLQAGDQLIYQTSDLFNSGQ